MMQNDKKVQKSIYIHSIYIVKCAKNQLSYGYLMVILWLSYGADSVYIAKW